ncbi:ATP-dependent DNA ligase [Clavibacter michiganensis]|uniref:DUF7882 domain-containing protein n=1 Tax=Clavibacter michiganensis TaxID=28447 RepID=A0A251YFU3_9MICO|nr:ATP-dependent DNA ligase [Clavibacter michiganensis]OUE23122.1 hypothetical protein BFL37_14275 [Clavibacter michiganensis]
MGQLIYDTTTHIDIDDRPLAHLQVVIFSKLRRKESFPFSWIEDRADGSGRSSVWLAPELPLRFRFAGNRKPTLNPQWVELLVATANTTAGLHLVHEPSSSEPALDRAARL